MRHISLLLIGAIFALGSCESEEPLKLTEECLIEARIDSKEAAKSAIVGEWHWVKTRYNLRSCFKTYLGAILKTEIKVLKAVSSVFNQFHEISLSHLNRF